MNINIIIKKNKDYKIIFFLQIQLNLYKYIKIYLRDKQFFFNLNLNNKREFYI